MKKYTILTVSLFIAFALKAQLFNIGGIDVGYLYVGPKVGGNASFNSVDDGTGADKSANYGYQFGGIAKLGLSEKLSIQPELVFSSKGFLQQTETIEKSANYKYVGIPITAKYAFVAISGVQIYGSGGFYTDYLTGGNTSFKSIATGNGQEEEITDFSTYNRIDFGLNFGGGATIPFKNNDQLNIDLLVGVGLTNAQKDNSTSSSRNTSIQLSLVYLVDLTKWVNFRGKSTKKSDAEIQNSAPAGGSKVERE